MWRVLKTLLSRLHQNHNPLILLRAERPEYRFFELCMSATLAIARHTQYTHHHNAPLNPVGLTALWLERLRNGITRHENSSLLSAVPLPSCCYSIGMPPCWIKLGVQKNLGTLVLLPANSLPFQLDIAVLWGPEED